MTDRAVSTTLSYVLTLSIATLLVTGLIFAGSTFVEDRREQVIRQELRVIGEHVATNVEQIDRYAAATDDLRSARLSQTYPPRVTGATYDVILRDGGGGGAVSTLYLNSTDPDVAVQIDVRTTADVAAESVADGGAISVECEVSAGSCDRIVIDSA